jgi:tetratricopeptide (TPR) repeat protein
MTEPAQQNTDLLQQAVAHHQSGDVAKAQVIYQAILATQPKHSDALHLLGVTHIQAKQYEQAIRLIDQALQGRPDMAAAHFNRALALKAMNQLEAAQAGFAKVLLLQADYTQALHPRGTVLHALGRAEEALQCFEELARRTPQDPSAHANLGVVLFELTRWQEAQVAFKKAMNLQPNHATHHFNIATAFQEQGCLEDALIHYDQAIALQDDFVDAHHNRGNVLKDLRRYEEALHSLERAMALRPGDAQAYSNQGNVFKAMLRLEDALRAYDEALRLRPDDADAMLNKSIALLLSGQFESGWQAYESRWETKSSRDRVRRFDVPAWRGETDLQGKTILLYTEQGLGDTLQFCRYAQVLCEMGARVVMEVPGSLSGVLRGLAGVSQWVIKGEALPNFDLHCPLLSLPLALQTSLETIPGRVAYLKASSDKIQAWSAKLGAPKRLRVGIAWRGSATHNNDRNRSLALEEFIEKLPRHVDYFSLQKDVRPEDAAVLSAASNVRHFGESLHDFTDTAALCELMDLVISVDTSVAHLSGALGKPTWVLLPYSPDWRWLMHRSDTPWYAAMRLFRQSADLQWAPVLETVAQELHHL